MLASVLFIYTANISTSFIVFSGLYKYMPHIILVFYPLERLIGPCFFFFIVFLVMPQRRFRWYDALHLIPFLYLLSEMWPFYLLEASIKTPLIEQMWFQPATMNTTAALYILLFNGIALTYITYAIFIVIKKIRAYKLSNSNTIIDYLEHIKKFAGIFLLTETMTMASALLSLSLEVQASIVEAIAHLCVTLFIQVIAYSFIKEPNKLFSHTFALVNPHKIDVQESAAIVPDLKLRDYMETHKPYLNPDLKIYDLAEMLEIAPNKLSRQINLDEGVNFYTFINNYRVEEFKKRVASNDFEHQTLLGIALDVGFNSKSSFNRIFKNVTQQTPSEFYREKKVSTSKNETIGA